MTPVPCGSFATTFCQPTQETIKANASDYDWLIKNHVYCPEHAKELCKGGAYKITNDVPHGVTMFCQYGRK